MDSLLKILYADLGVLHHETALDLLKVFAEPVLLTVPAEMTKVEQIFWAFDICVG